MKRMTVSPVFAYGYIATLAVGAIPGCLFAAFSFLTATFRPDRDPHILALLYDMGLLTFVGSLGCFATQYLILAIAILLDRRKVFPNWFAYVSIWQVVTEVLAAPVFIFKSGPFAWNGVISFWEGTALFGVYIGCLIMLLRKTIQSPDGTAAGPARSGAATRGLPGDIHMWVFVLGDLLIFSVYFIVYLVYRAHEPGVFLAAQRHLSLVAGVVNTLVLLASSRFIAGAVRAARAGDARRAVRLVAWAGGCGLVFAAIKAGEWFYLVSHGFTVQRDDFFMFYLGLTGVHLFHVLMGLLILGIAVRELRAPRLRRVPVIEACALYWHMVDLLWVILFALLYVMR
jgi:nitric oxide reductase NorE protein